MGTLVGLFTMFVVLAIAMLARVFAFTLVFIGAWAFLLSRDTETSRYLNKVLVLLPSLLLLDLTSGFFYGYYFMLLLLLVISRLIFKNIFHVESGLLSWIVLFLSFSVVLAFWYLIFGEFSVGVVLYGGGKVLVGWLISEYLASRYGF